jgi:hypothetical protein
MERSEDQILDLKNEIKQLLIKLGEKENSVFKE